MNRARCGCGKTLRLTVRPTAILVFCEHCDRGCIRAACSHCSAALEAAQ